MYILIHNICKIHPFYWVSTEQLLILLFCCFWPSGSIIHTAASINYSARLLCCMRGSPNQTKVSLPLQQHYMYIHIRALYSAPYNTIYHLPEVPYGVKHSILH